MSYDWMNEPELSQLPATTDQERLENLKLLAQRETMAAAAQTPDRIEVPQHYATSLSALRAARNNLPSVTVQAPPAQSAPPASPAQSASSAPSVSPELTSAVQRLKAAVSSLSPTEDLSDEALEAFASLGEALDVSEVFARIVSCSTSERGTAPDDRFGAITLAMDLREQGVCWREITERVNDLGYRNHNGEPWKLWALRRSSIRFAEKRGETITTTRSKR